MHRTLLQHRVFTPILDVVQRFGTKVTHGFLLSPTNNGYITTTVPESGPGYLYGKLLPSTWPLQLQNRANGSYRALLHFRLYGREWKGSRRTVVTSTNGCLSESGK